MELTRANEQKCMAARLHLSVSGSHHDTMIMSPLVLTIIHPEADKKKKKDVYAVGAIVIREGQR